VSTIAPFELRTGDDRPFWNADAQTMDRGQLTELRETRLRDAVQRAIERPVPHFARKLREAGIEHPDDVTTLADLDAVPVTVKQELRDSEAAYPPVGDYRATELRDNVKIGTSTGTTGTPTIALWTKHDLAVDCETGARMFWASGIRPGNIVTHAHPSYLYAGGPMQTMVYEHMGCLTIHVPPPDTDELAEHGLRMWQRVTPDFPLMGFATATFMSQARKLGIDPAEAGLDFSKMPHLGGSGGALGLMTAGAECFSYLGAPCHDGGGAHLADDFTYVQALGEDGRSVPDGEWGRLVVTTFGRDNFLLRYDLEEAVRLDSTPCGCGATSTRGWWGGRFADLITIQGRSFLLTDIERALGTVRAVRKGGVQYVVVRPAGGAAGRSADDAAPLRLRVEVGEGFDDGRDEVRTAIRRAFDAELGIRAEPEVLDRDTLPRAGFKTARVVDA
jgi:phenylacetate-CoA ligase